jgi:hypothetical protein
MLRQLVFTDFSKDCILFEMSVSTYQSIRRNIAREIIFHAKNLVEYFKSSENFKILGCKLINTIQMAVYSVRRTVLTFSKNSMMYLKILGTRQVICSKFKTAEGGGARYFCTPVVCDCLILCRASFIDLHSVAQLVEALRYKPEGLGFDSR